MNNLCTDPYQIPIQSRGGEHMNRTKWSARTRILAPLFISFFVMAAAFVGISYKAFRDYTIEDCVNYAYGLNGLIADDLDVDHINDYIEQGRAHPDYERIERHLYKLRDAYPDIRFLYVYQIREDGCHVVFDLDTEDFPSEEPGDVVDFDEAFRDSIPDLLAGREIKPVISNDYYGYLLTIYTPIYDTQGVCQCYVAVDYSMDLLTDYVWAIIRQIILFFVVVVIANSVVAVLVTNRGVVKPMKELEQHAYRDTLTGLQNRTAYQEHSQALDGRIGSGNADFSILMVDVNFLKRMNDTYGHEKGNAYLKNAADLLSHVFGRDFLYRTGGDEFVIVMEDEAQDSAENMIRQFKHIAAGAQANPGLQPWQKVSAAIGIAKYEPGRDVCAADVLKRADAAMYQDKLAMKAERRD